MGQGWSSGEVGRAVLSARFLSTVGVAFLLMLGFSLVSPLVPTVVADFGISRAQGGLLLTSFALGRLSFNLIGGILGDRYGIRQLALASCIVTVAASVMAAFTDLYGVVLLARVVQGAGSGLYMTVTVGYVLRIAPAGHVAKLLSFHQTAILLAVTAGPGLGGVIAEFAGFRGTFLAYALFALSGVVPSIRWLPSTPPGGEDNKQLTAGQIKRERRASLRRLLSHRSFIIVMAVGFIVFALRAGYGNTVLPLFAVERFGLSEAQVGLVLTAAAVGNLLVLLHAGRTVDDLGRRAVLVRSMIVLTLVTAAFHGMISPWIILLVSFMLGAVKGYAAVVPHAVLSDLADPRVRNTGVAILRMTTDSGILVGPVVAGALVDSFGFATSFWTGLVAVALVTAISFGMRETSTMADPRPA